MKVLHEQVAWDVIVLVLTHVGDDKRHCSNLVAFQSSVDCWSVVVSVFSFLDFVTVENRELAREKLPTDVFVKQMGHRSAVKGQDWSHISSIELKEGLVEDERSWLPHNDLTNFWLSFADIETLEEEELSKGDLVELDGINQIVICLFTVVFIYFFKLLLDLNDSVVLGTLKENKVTFVYFEVVDWLKGMNHPLTARLIDYSSLVDSTHRDDVETGLVKSDEVVVSLKHETSHFTLPKLEALVPKESCLHYIGVRDIHDSHIVGIDVNGFVTDD